MNKILEELIHCAKEAIKEIGKDFTEPDDDWRATLLLGREGHADVLDIQTCMENSNTKDEFTSILPHLLLYSHATAAVMVSSCWIRFIDPTHPFADVEIGLMNQFGVRNDPKREEMVMIQGSDGEETITLQAKILRHTDKPPTLGEWEEIKEERGEGRFHNILRSALLQARKEQP